jgi:hypothetical protein
MRLLATCSGAIILGYPQITVERGMVKGTPLTQPMTLATEWNHIEAALAYSRKMPLLVIHHSGLQRGVFDHGAIGKFIYEIDLTNAGWALNERVRGALTNWKGQVDRSAAPTHEAGFSSSDRSAGQSKGELSADHYKILAHIANSEHGSMTVDAISGDLKLPRQKTLYYLDGLVGSKCLLRLVYFFGAPDNFQLQPKGRDELMRRNLL